jgi:hypothetical protein
VTITTVAGVPSVPLPSDFGQLRRVSRDGLTLAYVGPTSIPGMSGPPLAYTLWGATNLWLGPAPDTAYEIEILYQSGVPPLSDSNPTNWLLAANPDAYLFGCLVEAELYIGHDERAPLWTQRLEACFASIEQAARKARWGSPLSITVDGITAPSGGGGSGGANPATVMASVGDGPPANPHSGDLWWDSSTGSGGGQLYVWFVDPSGEPGQWVAATNQPGSPSPGVEGVATVTPASGDTVTVDAAAPNVYILSPVLAALTVRLHALPVNGNAVQLSFAAPVTALQVQDFGGAAVAGAPASAYGPGAALIFRFISPNWIYWK